MAMLIVPRFHRLTQLSHTWIGSLINSTLNTVADTLVIHLDSRHISRSLYPSTHRPKGIIKAMRIPPCMRDRRLGQDTTIMLDIIMVPELWPTLNLLFPYSRFVVMSHRSFLFTH